VTYGTANDFFFSGHTAIAVYGAAELCRTGSFAIGALGVAIALLEAATVIVLRAHWTADVFAGTLAALAAAWAAPRIAPWVDVVLASLAS
jgi:membrane-associated phospholipid phosphatase